MQTSNLGTIVRTLREQRGWSQSELERRSGVGRSTISEIESGTRDPRGGTLEPLATALGTTIDVLLGKAGGDALNGDKRNTNPLPETARILENERDYLGPEDLAEIDEVVASLATARANRNRRRPQRPDD